MLKSLHALYQHNSWLWQIIWVLLTTALIHLCVRFAYRKLNAAFDRTKNMWDDIVLNSLYLPAMSMLWIGAVALSWHLSILHHPNLASYSAGRSVFYFLTIVIVVWLCLRFISQTEREFIENNGGRKRPADPTTVTAVGRILRLVVFATALLFVMQSFGLPISGLLAFGGAGTLVVGLAGKDVLANFFGGMMLYLDRPFKVGDWIRSPDRNIEGTVENIGWRLCRIRTFDQRPLYVPNSILSTISVENPSRMHNRRIKAIINLRYDDVKVIPELLKAIEHMLRMHPAIDINKTLMVNLVELAATSLDIMVYTFTKTTNWAEFQAIQQDVLLKIMALIEEHGAECAFPTQTLEVPKGISLQGINLQPEQ